MIAGISSLAAAKALLYSTSAARSSRRSYSAMARSITSMLPIARARSRKRSAASVTPGGGIYSVVSSSFIFLPPKLGQSPNLNLLSANVPRRDSLGRPGGGSRTSCGRHSVRKGIATLYGKLFQVRQFLLISMLAVEGAVVFPRLVVHAAHVDIEWLSHGRPPADAHSRGRARHQKMTLWASRQSPVQSYAPPRYAPARCTA